MLNRISKLLVLGAFGLLPIAPAMADVHANLGPLHIRISDEAPPRVRYERRPQRPDRDSVWIKGYWDRRDTRWEWVSGRWEQPPDRHERWVDARYRRDQNAWRYEPGHWSQQQLVEDDEYRQWHEKHNHR